jgi:hypothetical protein
MIKVIASVYCWAGVELSVAWIKNEKLPALVGVPLSTAVVGPVDEIESPGGNGVPATN